MDREAGDPMEPVQIGVREIYDLLMSLDGKLDSYIHAQEPRLALMDHRLTRVEEHVASSGENQWRVWLAVGSSVVAIICAFVAPIVVK